jgi:PhoPQ-activated pathogenicity-related protein
MLGTNDRYWPLDACNLYWDGLQGEKFLIYVPNNGHGLADRSRLVAGLNAINRRILTGQPLPKLQWSFSEAGSAVKLRIESDTTVSRLKLWTTTAPTRDFRDSKWTTNGPDTRGKDFNVVLSQPSDGNAAYFGELIFNEGQDDQFSLSTNVRIVPSNSAAAGGGK